MVTKKEVFLFFFVFLVFSSAVVSSSPFKAYSSKITTCSGMTCNIPDGLSFSGHSLANYDNLLKPGTLNSYSSSSPSQGKDGARYSYVYLKYVFDVDINVLNQYNSITLLGKFRNEPQSGNSNQFFFIEKSGGNLRQNDVGNRGASSNGYFIFDYKNDMSITINKADYSKYINNGKITIYLKVDEKSVEKKGCAFVYSYDGEEYIPEFSISSDSSHKLWESSGYGVLPSLKKIDGKYSISIWEQVLETQYIDDLKLIKIIHPTGMWAIPEYNGGFNIFDEKISPISALDESNISYLEEIENSDNKYWLSDVDKLNSENYFGNLTVKFDLSEYDGSKFNLAFSLKETGRIHNIWVDIVTAIEGYNKKNYSLFNKDFDLFYGVTDWIMQTVPILIYQKQRDGTYKLLDSFIPGNVEMYHTFSLSLNRILDVEEIVFVSAYGLYQIDEIYASSEKNIKYKIEKINPTVKDSNLDMSTSEIEKLLKNKDWNYLILNYEDFVNIDFVDNSILEEGMDETLVIYSSAYAEAYSHQNENKSEVNNNLEFINNLIGDKNFIVKYLKENYKDIDIYAKGLSPVERIYEHNTFYEDYIGLKLGSGDCIYNNRVYPNGQASGDEIGKPYLYCDNGIWRDQDSSANYCVKDSKGRSLWNMGGNGAGASTCCGDDISGEYPIYSLFRQNSLSLCCKFPTDCVGYGETAVEKKCYNFGEATNDGMYKCSADNSWVVSSTNKDNIFGTGSINNPYVIKNCYQLRKIYSPDSEYPYRLDSHYILKNDIDCGGGEIYPIGNLSNKFVGNFNGNGYYIKNFKILQTGKNYIGIFGVVGEGGIIRNLKASGGMVRGQNYVGGIVGSLESGAKIENSFFSGTVRAAYIDAKTTYNGNTIVVSSDLDSLNSVSVPTLLSSGSTNIEKAKSECVGESLKWDDDVDKCYKCTGRVDLTGTGFFDESGVCRYSSSGDCNHDGYNWHDGECYGVCKSGSFEKGVCVQNRAKCEQGNNVYIEGHGCFKQVSSSYVSEQIEDFCSNNRCFDPDDYDEGTTVLDDGYKVVKTTNPNPSESGYAGTMEIIAPNILPLISFVSANDVSNNIIVGGNYIGGLVGRSGGIIDSCYVSGGSSIATDGGSYRYVGGLVGEMYDGIINNSYVASNIYIGSVGSSVDVGGFIGIIYKKGMVYNSYVGEIGVRGDDYVGGFVSRIEGCTTSSCAIDSSFTLASLAASEKKFAFSSYDVGCFASRNSGKISNVFYKSSCASVRYSPGIGCGFLWLGRCWYTSTVNSCLRNSGGGCSAVNFVYKGVSIQESKTPFDKWDFSEVWEKSSSDAFPTLKWISWEGGVYTNQSLIDNLCNDFGYECGYSEDVGGECKVSDCASKGLSCDFSRNLCVKGTCDSWGCYSDSAISFNYVDPTPVNNDFKEDKYVKIRTKTYESFLKNMTFNFSNYSGKNNLLVNYNFNINSIVAGISFEGNRINNEWMYNRYITKLNPLDISYSSYDGVDGNYVSFNGNGGVLKLTLSEEPTDNFSFGAWVRTSKSITLGTQSPTGTQGTSGQNYAFWPTNGGVCSTSDSNSKAGAGLSIGTNGVAIYEHCNSYMPAVLVHNSDLGKGWHHIMVVYKNKIPTLYIDGIKIKDGVIGSGSGRVVVPSSIGTNSSYGMFKGDVDEIKIFNKPLTDSEVKSYYNSNLKKIDGYTWEFSIVVRDLDYVKKNPYTYSFGACNERGDCTKGERNLFIVESAKPVIKVDPLQSENINEKTYNITNIGDIPVYKLEPILDNTELSTILLQPSLNDYTGDYIIPDINEDIGYFILNSGGSARVTVKFKTKNETNPIFNNFSEKSFSEDDYRLILFYENLTLNLFSNNIDDVPIYTMKDVDVDYSLECNEELDYYISNERYVCRCDNFCKSGQICPCVVSPTHKYILGLNGVVKIIFDATRTAVVM